MEVKVSMIAKQKFFSSHPLANTTIQLNCKIIKIYKTLKINSVMSILLTLCEHRPSLVSTPSITQADSPSWPTRMNKMSPDKISKPPLSLMIALIIAPWDDFLERRPCPPLAPCAITLQFIDFIITIFSISFVLRCLSYKWKKMALLFGLDLG